MAQLSGRFEDALLMASRLHRNQRRKGTDIPYVSHLMAVAGIALELGADEDQAIAALLHDAVEDQGGLETLAKIEEQFGEKVAAIVIACSDAETLPKPPWRERKEAYLAKLSAKRADALLVSLADKMHNARTIVDDLETHGEAVWDRFRGGKQGTLWYYAELANRFGALTPGPGSRRLAAVVQKMHEISVPSNAAP